MNRVRDVSNNIVGSEIFLELLQMSCRDFIACQCDVAGDRPSCHLFRRMAPGLVHHNFRSYEEVKNCIDW